jgi:hypothetical protein
MMKASVTHEALVLTTMLEKKNFCIALAGLNDCAAFGNKKEGWNTYRIRI